MAVIMRHGTAGALISLAWLLAIACGGTGEVPVTTGGQAGPLRVITTTALLADLVESVGGDLVTVRSIVPAGADVHSFQTTPEDSITISRARVIVSNGFGLDAFLEPVLRSAKEAQAVQVIAAEGLDSSGSRGAESQEGGDGAGNLNEPGHPQKDPHFWQNPVFAIYYVQQIRDGLASADPDHKPEYAANAETYIEELRELDREIVQTLGRVPSERRHLVTFHDAFSHFGQRYGWRVSAFVDSDADEVAPAAVVRVLDRVKNEGLPAVFVEPQLRSDVIQRAADDAGVTVWPIHSDIPGTGATSYIEMMRFNAETLAEHLR
jgi:manganese/iron transport system substrate-binding protein